MKIKTAYRIRLTARRIAAAALAAVLCAACTAAAQPTGGSTTAIPLTGKATGTPAVSSATHTMPPTYTVTVTNAPPTSTATSAPSATQAALAADGPQGWCLPEGAAQSLAADPLHPPETARIGINDGTGLKIGNLPAAACVFLYTLNQPRAEGLSLQVYEPGAAAPWLTADLNPVEGSPNQVSALLQHAYITAPPLWEWNYEFALVSADGKELRRDPVAMRRWEPQLCWNGQRPNVTTLRCPLPLDLHPWDAGYGTPIPTGLPE